MRNRRTLLMLVTWLLVASHGWSMTADARRSRVTEFCVRLVSGIGRALLPKPLPPAQILAPSPIPEIPAVDLQLYAATPHGADVEIIVGNQRFQGVVIAATYQWVQIHGVNDAIRWSDVSSVRVLSTEPQITPDVAATIRSGEKRDARLRRYLAFQKLNDLHWESLAEYFDGDLEEFRALDDAARRKRLLSLATQLDSTVRAMTGLERYGLHFNSNFAPGHQYVSTGGILATPGDSTAPPDYMGLGIPMPRGPVPNTVFYYPMKERGLGHYVLTVRPNSSTTRSVGHYAMLFDPQGILNARRGLHYSNESAPAVEFRQLDGTRIGARYDDDFLLPPILVNTDVPRRVGQETLSTHEQLLATLLHLNVLLCDPRTQELSPRRRLANVEG